MTRDIDAVLTIDVHEGDSPHALLCSADWLQGRNLTACYFVPTALLGVPELRAAVRALLARGFELGTHGHAHSWQEVAALEAGAATSLQFLRTSRDAFADALGIAPHVFRSPGWCGLSPRAFAALSELGYRVDSSATPQRPGLLGSRPFRNPWLAWPRGITRVHGELHEVPQSTLLVPLAHTAYRMFGAHGARLLLRLLRLEARLAQRGGEGDGARRDRRPPRRCLVLQFHPSDFDPAFDHPCPRRPDLRDLLPRAQGGIRARAWLLEHRGQRIHAAVHALVDALKGARCLNFARLLGDA